MAGIEVRTDQGAYGLAQTKPRFGVVDAEARVHFQRDFLHPVRGGKGGRTPPVGNEHLLPLVFQNFLIIIRPGTGNPVGRAILRAAAGTAAEAHNALYAQPFGQQHRVLKVLPKGFGHVRVGMDGVAVRAERRQLQTVFLQYALECGQRAFILQKKGRVAMRLAGIAAAADFHRVHAALGQVLHGAFNGHVAQHMVKNRELHDGGHSFCSPGIRLHRRFSCSILYLGLG